MKTLHLLCLACLCFFFACKNDPAPLVSAADQDTIDTAAVGIERISPELDALIAPGTIVEILAEGFDWTEGPLWVSNGGYLLFSDIPPNKIMKWEEGGFTSLYLKPSGFTGTGEPSAEPGSNGLLLDAVGNLILCQHGDRRMAKMNAPLDQPKPDFTTLADKWNGKRLNSPNDAVFDKNGNLWFTDPPYGLPKQAEDPGKEIPFQGVYRMSADGKVEMKIDSITRPNGIAFSPDEKTLYIASSDPERAIWMAYDVQPNGNLTNGRLFHDATEKVKTMKGLPDGLKVNEQGILFATGPGGVWIFKPDGTAVGRIKTGQATSNCAFGNDGKALYITADMYLMRVKLR